LKIRIAEIYSAVSGEVGFFHQGTPVTIIRLGGCNLQCGYCDTPDTQSKQSGELLDMNDVIEQVVLLGWRNILITGGEPLVQREAFKQLVVWLGTKKIAGQYCQVQVETNGTIKLVTGDGVQCWVMDYKMEAPPSVENMLSLGYGDWLKFVVQNKKDFIKAEEVIKNLRKCGAHASMAISPVVGGNLTAGQVWQWMKEDKLDAVLNVQLHKLIDLP